jgi:hypothetical protein
VTADEGFDPRWDGATIPEAHWHLHRQLYARYRIVMAPGDFSDMISGFRSGRAILESKARGRSLHAWRLKTSGRLIVVLASNGTPFTIFPPTRRLAELARQAFAAARVE